MFTLATAEGRLADIIRTRLVPPAIPAAARFKALREWMFWTVSPVMINCRESPLSLGAAGNLRGGERLPWVSAGGTDNYRPLSATTWQVHVCGETTAEVAGWCRERGLPLHAFGWHDTHEAAGFARNALYLLRPDTYIAMADKTASAAALDGYFSERGLGRHAR